MASGGCEDAFVTLMDCVAAAVHSGALMTTTTTQPLPCLDAAGSFMKCMEENSGKYAHTLDRIASGAGEGETDDNKANGNLVLVVTSMQEEYVEVQEVVDVPKAVAAMELRIKECKHAFEALQECVAGMAAGGMTLPLPCVETLVSLDKCMETCSGLRERSRCRQGWSIKYVTACQPQPISLGLH